MTASKETKTEREDLEKIADWVGIEHLASSVNEFFNSKESAGCLQIEVPNLDFQQVKKLQNNLLFSEEYRGRYECERKANRNNDISSGKQGEIENYSLIIKKKEDNFPRTY